MTSPTKEASFTIRVTCDACGSTNVDFYPENCEDCGNFIEFSCNKCKLHTRHPYGHYSQEILQKVTKGNEEE